jgi:general stress protein CsbA
MAKVLRKKERKAFTTGEMPLSRPNFVIMGIALVVIVAGYASMLEGSVESIWTLTISPILLVLGYCVLIPVGILYKKSNGQKEGSEKSAA